MADVQSASMASSCLMNQCRDFDAQESMHDAGCVRLLNSEPDEEGEAVGTWLSEIGTEVIPWY